MSTQLTQEQLTILQGLRESGSYAGAYTQLVLRQISFSRCELPRK